MKEQGSQPTDRQVPFGRPITAAEEREAIGRVLDSGLLVHGPVLRQFESLFARFTNAPHAIGTSSCTAALHLAYHALGIGSGDEVIVPAQTHTATAHAVELVGAKPVFVDADETTGNVAIEQIEPLITGCTRAISIVHFLGLPVDMQLVCRLAERHGLHIIEDCALALGASLEGTHVGLWGTVGCFSFYPIKHITTAEGGMAITRDGELAAKLSHLRAFGVDRQQGERRIPGMYDVTMVGYNYRMSEIHAAIGQVQMDRLPGFLARRKQNYAVLTQGLREIEEIDLLKSGVADRISSHYCHALILKPKWAARRNDLIKELGERGVGTSIYYPRPVPLMTHYREKYGYREGDFPSASRISDRSIALPVGPHLGTDDMEYITIAVKEAICRVTGG
ncbi:MAG: DegT/DnrJ/EryC1/StrS family aminotransferase [Candidatus Eisenbacteria sp.]|nr:DegT/DnrJ/EryC1/StrS family aminotransferase [Candidatus Eisenbacteria bacterium]